MPSNSAALACTKSARTSAADKRGFDALKGIGKIKLHRKQIHGALELRFLVADLGGQILG